MKNRLFSFLLIFLASFAFAQEKTVAEANVSDDSKVSVTANEESGAVTVAYTQKESSTIAKEELKNKPKMYSNDKYTFIPAAAKIVLTADENESGVLQIAYGLNSSIKELYKGPFYLSQEGRNVINYDVLDVTNNVSDSKVKVFYMDKTAPELSIAINGRSLVFDKKIYIAKESTIELKAKDALSGIDKIYYTIDGQNYNEYVGPFNLEKDGEVMISAYAYDNVGNISDEHIRVVHADVTAPLITVVTSETAKVVNDVNFYSSRNVWTVKTREDGVGLKAIYYSLDDADYAVFDKYLKVEENGLHNLKFFAVDLLDNKSEELEFEFNVDAIDPTVKLEVEF